MREAVHADAAIRFGSSAKPRNRLRSIAAFGSKGVKLASGISPAAHILNHDVVSMPSEPNRMGKDNSGGDGAPIRLTHQKSRVWILSRRIVVIRKQLDSV